MDTYHTHTAFNVRADECLAVHRHTSRTGMHSRSEELHFELANRTTVKCSSVLSNMWLLAVEFGKLVYVPVREPDTTVQYLTTVLRLSSVQIVWTIYTYKYSTPVGFIHQYHMIERKL